MLAAIAWLFKLLVVYPLLVAIAFTWWPVALALLAGAVISGIAAGLDPKPYS